MHGLASSAFARHYSRNHGCFLFLRVLRCFTSPRSLLLPYVFRQRSPDITPVSFEVSLFGDPRIEARLPAPRGLSQVTTSFIGSWCQDIHRLPLVACHNNKHKEQQKIATKMLASTIQFSKYGQEHQPQTTTHQQQTPNPGKQHTQIRHPHQQFGESRPQPPHQPTSV